MGLTFASLLIAQQAAIFIGLMARAYGSISDVGGVDVWVMDPKVQFIDDIKPAHSREDGAERLRRRRSSARRHASVGPFWLRGRAPSASADASGRTAGYSSSSLAR